MKTFRWFRVLLGVAAIALLALSYLATLPATAGHIEAAKGGTESALAPSEVTAQFYEGYLDYIRVAGDGLLRNPLVDKAYHSMPFVSEELATRVDGILASFEGGGYDPFLCAQDVPEWMEATEVSREGQRATVEVRSSFVGHAFRVDLQERGGQWLITDVRCK